MRPCFPAFSSHGRRIAAHPERPVAQRIRPEADWLVVAEGSVAREQEQGVREDLPVEASWGPCMERTSVTEPRSVGWWFSGASLPVKRSRQTKVIERSIKQMTGEHGSIKTTSNHDHRHRTLLCRFSSSTRFVIYTKQLIS